MCFLVDLVQKKKKIITNIKFNKIGYFLKKSKHGQNSPKNFKKGIFVTKINNTFDFSSQKSKKNRSCFSQTFHMESPNVTKQKKSNSDKTYQLKL